MMSPFRLISGRFCSIKFFNLVVGQPSVWPLQRPDDAGVRPANLDDLPLLATADCPRLICCRWFQRGARAWLIEQDGRLVACFWLHETAQYQLYDWLVLKTAGQEVWVVWWWVDRHCRGRDSAYRVRVPGVLEFARTGCTRMFGMVDVLNRGAVAATQKLNWKTIGRLYLVQFAGVTAVFAPRLFRIGRWSLGAPLEIELDRLTPESTPPETELHA